jgi:hypothetical protein
MRQHCTHLLSSRRAGTWRISMVFCLSRRPTTGVSAMRLRVRLVGSAARAAAEQQRPRHAHHQHSCSSQVLQEMDTLIHTCRVASIWLLEPGYKQAQHSARRATQSSGHDERHALHGHALPSQQLPGSMSSRARHAEQAAIRKQQQQRSPLGLPSLLPEGLPGMSTPASLPSSVIRPGNLCASLLTLLVCHTRP